ncbi:MAG: hypothetical protein MUF31_18850 [Akkermansiaceae bacterium]|jgi:hypothetical protein|nr:hypothetical protein [Akkermansiaceae bacterium]
MVLKQSALLLEGNVAEPLAAAMRSGRMGTERAAFATIAALLDYECRNTPVPLDFLILRRDLDRWLGSSGR